jgi:predicted nucleic acid-binding protein
VALAEVLDASFCTGDVRLARAVQTWTGLTVVTV